MTTEDNSSSPKDERNPQVIHIQPQAVQYQSASYHQPVPPHIVTSITIGQPMGTKPSVAVCKSCNYDIVTRIEKKAATRTHVCAVLLCLFLCWPCVCLPYCIPSCNNVDHYCPNCHNYIGSYHFYYSS